MTRFFRMLRENAPLILVFLCLTILAACKENEAEKGLSQAIPPLLERKGELAKAAEWPKTKTDAAGLEQKIAQNPEDMRSRLLLAMLYMREVRVTGEGNYYYAAIVKILNSVLEQDPKNFEANTFKASVAMSQHQFAQGRELAMKAKGINPYNGYVYGVLVDADVELGSYQEAVAMSDQMQSIRPSLESYSRASYLREIFGDYPGAKAAMRMAVEAGVPGSESAEWSRAILGDLYLATGHPDTAKMLYQSSLNLRPDYTPALIGLAKVARAEKQYPQAIDYVKQAIRIMSETAYVVMLGDLYELNGEKDKAADTRKDVVDLLEDARSNERKDAEIKHNANRELAQAYLNANNLDKAAEFAKNDLALRPDNIDANELSGWVAYRRGDYAAARSYAEKSLRTGTKNAEKLYKAGLIFTKAGDAAKGDSLKKEALAINSYLDSRLLAY